MSNKTKYSLILLLVAITVSCAANTCPTNKPNSSCFYKLNEDHTLSPVKLEQGDKTLLVEGLIFAESGGDPKARSHVGARGLIQVMPRTALYILKKLEPSIGKHGLADLDDPKINLIVGLTYMVEMYHRFGDTHGTLTAYNRGPAKSKKGMVTAYSKKILKYVENNP